MNSKIEDLYLECFKNTFPSSLLDILTTRGLSEFIGLAKIVFKWIVECFGNNWLSCNIRFTANMMKTIKITVFEFEYFILGL